MTGRVEFNAKPIDRDKPGIGDPKSFTASVGTVVNTNPGEGRVAGADQGRGQVV